MKNLQLLLVLTVIVVIISILAGWKYFSKPCAPCTPCTPCVPCAPCPQPIPQPTPQPVPSNGGVALTCASVVNILNTYKLDNEGMMQAIVGRLSTGGLTQQDVSNLITQYNLVQGTGKYALKCCPENDPTATFVFFYDRTLGSIPPCPF